MSTLLNLPLELIEIILHQLSLQESTIIRKVCKWLRDFVDIKYLQNLSIENRHYILHSACQHGLINRIRSITYGVDKSEFTDTVSSSLIIICCKGYLNILQHFVYLGCVSYADMMCSEGIFHALRNGHFKMIQWIFQYFDITISDYRLQPERHQEFSNFIIHACRSGNIKLAKWIVCKLKFNTPDSAVLIQNALLSKNIKLIKWMILRFDIPRIYIILDNSLHHCFSDKNLQFIKWILTPLIKEKRVNQNIRIRLVILLGNGTIDIVKWIAKKFSISKDDIRHQNCASLVTAYHDKNFNLVKWLIKWFKLSLYDVYNSSIFTFLLDDNLLKWIILFFNIRPSSKSKTFNNVRKSIFTTLCQYGKIDMAIWVAHQIGIMRIDVIKTNGYFNIALLAGDINFLDWIVKRFKIITSDIDVVQVHWCEIFAKNDIKLWIAKTFNIM